MSKFTAKQIARFKAIAKSKKEANERKFAKVEKVNELLPLYLQEVQDTAWEAMRAIEYENRLYEQDRTWQSCKQLLLDTRDFSETLSKFELTMKKGTK